MAIAFVAGTAANSTDGDTITTSAITTTGANLTVGRITSYVGSTAPTCIDSKSNSYTGLTTQNIGDGRVRLWYKLAPTVGTGHTFGLSQASSFASLSGAAFSGVASYDSENGATAASVTTLQTGAVTVAVGDLVVTAISGSNAATSYVVPTGYTLVGTATDHTGVSLSGAAAYKIITVAGTENPTWNWTGADNASAAIAVFKAAGGASPATTYAVTGPTSGAVGVASTTFTATPDGTSSDTVTPATNGSGTFTPGAVTFDGTATPKTFTYTPTSTSGSPHTLSFTNSGSLANPANKNYTVLPAPVVIAVNDAALFYSPYNWFKSGSSYALSNNPGAYLMVQFSGTSIKMTVDVSALTGAGESAGNYPTIGYFIDGAYTRLQLTSASTQLTLASGLADTTHRLDLFFVAAWFDSDRWSAPVQALKITGFEIDGGKVVSAVTPYTRRAIVYHDSNGEGYESLATGVTVANQDAGLSHALFYRHLLRAEVGLVAFAAQGYTVAVPSANLPNLQSSWPLYSAGRSRLTSGLFSPAPDAVICPMGQNDGVSVQVACQAMITAWRAAAPLAAICICSPPNQNRASDLSAAVAASLDANAFWIPIPENLLNSTTFSNGTHLTGLRGQPRYAGMLGAGITAALFAVPASYTSAANVRLGTDRGDGVTGTCAIPSAANVLSGVSVDATTGTYVVVATSNVKSGVTYGAGSALTGTYTVTLPTAAQVLTGVSFGAPQTSLTGTVTLPSAAAVLTSASFGPGGATAGTYVAPLAATVQSGVPFGPSSSLTGSFDPVTGNYTNPGAGNVVSPVVYKFAGTTFTGTFTGGSGGTYSDPGSGNVKIGVGYIFNNVAFTGTYDGSDRWSDVGIAHVEQGFAYRANSTSVNRTGTLENPTDEEIAIAWWTYFQRTLTE